MIEQSQRTMTILFFALMASVGMYGFILLQVTQGQTPKEIDPPAFLYALIVVALAQMAFIPVLRRIMLPPMREARSLDEPVPEGGKVQQALQKLQTASIVSWALCESIAIYGLLLAFLSFQMKYFFPFAAVSLVNFLIYRPRREQLLGAARAAG
jgi:F0F1-type ATP synthase membrane subunit c/vacuolar-type H+-ATPase subunit K